jgi:uncharacterized membrane protein (UPF0182 family)
MAPSVKRSLQVAVVVLLPVLLLGRWLASGTAEALWAEALGVAATHGLIHRLQTLLFLTAFSGAAVWCLGNLYVVYRAIGSVHVPRRLGNLEILEAVPRRYLLIAAVAAGLLLAIAFSFRADGWWYVRALAGYRVSLGATDPVLGRDLGYYLYQLPWSRTVHSFVTLLSGVMLAVIGLLYAAVGAVRWTGRRLRVGDLARWHLAGLLAAFAVALFWGYRLEPVEYVAGIHGVPSDTVLTTVRLPVANALSILALVAATASVSWVRFPRVAVVAVPWIVLASVSFVGHYVVPTFAAAVRTPDELALESVEARRDTMVDVAFAARPPTMDLVLTAVADPSAARGHAEALTAAPLWDGFTVGVLLNRTVGAEPPARFGDATLGLYAARDGSAVPVYVAARAVDPATIPPEELSWGAVHRGPYAAATGAAAIQAHRVAAAGLPYFVPDLSRPDSALAQVSELALARRVVRFRPAAADFAVVAPEEGTVVGVPAGGLFRRMALAWTLQSSRVVTSDLVTGQSLIVWHRDVLERLERYAPFAAFSDARAVVVGDTLYWLASGLVSADAFPLAPTVRWRDENVRYLRSSLIGVVEAATGRSAVYLTRDTDPLTAAWAALAPEIVRPAGELPRGLQRHLAYPAELFAVQVALLRARSDPVGAGAVPLGGNYARRSGDPAAAHGGAHCGRRWRPCRHPGRHDARRGAPAGASRRRAGARRTGTGAGGASAEPFAGRSAAVPGTHAHGAVRRRGAGAANQLRIAGRGCRAAIGGHRRGVGACRGERPRPAHRADAPAHGARALRHGGYREGRGTPLVRAHGCGAAQRGLGGVRARLRGAAPHSHQRAGHPPMNRLLRFRASARLHSP